MIVKLLCEYDEENARERDVVIDMLNVGKYKGVLYELDQWLREMIKYKNVSAINPEKVREYLWELLREDNLDIND